MAYNYLYRNFCLQNILLKKIFKSNKINKLQFQTIILLILNVLLI